MKNVLSFMLMMLLAISISSCASLDDVIVISPAPNSDKEYVSESESTPVQEPEQKPAPEPEPEPEPKPEPPKPAKEIKQAIQEAVKEEKKEFTIDFEKLSKQSLFEFNSDKVSEDSYAALDIIADFLKETPNVSVKVEGHTDNIGAKEYNQRLSERRAESVANYLIDKGVDNSRVTIQGFGFSKPIASNKTEEGRSMNRRTEIKFTVK